MSKTLNLKVVVVGDGGVGKSCLIAKLATGKFPGDYIPSVFDFESVQTSVGGKKVRLGLWDSRVREDNERLRVMSYPQTDIFFICFDKMNPRTFDRVKEVWVPETSTHGDKAPCVILGLKSDLEHDSKLVSNLASKGLKPISTKMGEDLAMEVGALSYRDVSALTENLGPFLEDVIHLAIENPAPANSNKTSKKSSRCQLM